MGRATRCASARSRRFHSAITRRSAGVTSLRRRCSGSLSGAAGRHVVRPAPLVFVQGSSAAHPAEVAPIARGPTCWAAVRPRRLQSGDDRERRLTRAGAQYVLAARLHLVGASHGFYTGTSRTAARRCGWWCRRVVLSGPCQVRGRRSRDTMSPHRYWRLRRSASSERRRRHNVPRRWALTPIGHGAREPVMPSSGRTNITAFASVDGPQGDTPDSCS